MNVAHFFSVMLCCDLFTGKCCTYLYCSYTAAVLVWWGIHLILVFSGLLALLVIGSWHTNVTLYFMAIGTSADKWQDKKNISMSRLSLFSDVFIFSLKMTVLDVFQNQNTPAPLAPLCYRCLVHSSHFWFKDIKGRGILCITYQK